MRLEPHVLIQHAKAKAYFYFAYNIRQLQRIIIAVHPWAAKIVCHIPFKTYRLQFCEIGHAHLSPPDIF